MQASKKNGTLYVMATAVLFSLGGVGIKYIPWPALAINGARNGIATVIIFIYLKAIRHKVVVNRSVLIGSCCMFVTTTLYVMANKLTTAANAIVLQFTAPVFIILAMWIFFHERPTRLDVSTCAVVLAGICFFFIDGLRGGGTLGNALALLSGVSYAGVFMMSLLEGSDSLSSILLGQGVSAIVGLPFLLQMQRAEFTRTAIAAVVMLGVFQLGLAYILFSKGLETTPPVVASLTTGIEPILNPVWVAIFHGEMISPLSLVGAVVVVGAIVVYNVKKAKQEQH